MTEEEKPAFYKMTDIFVLPTLRDPWGLTINEAMICERPIVTTEDAGAKELVRDNGLVVPSGNEDALYSALEELLSDKEKLKRMGESSWQIIQEYSIENKSNVFLAAISYVNKSEL